jgi:hypothetical protein
MNRWMTLGTGALLRWNNSCRGPDPRDFYASDSPVLDEPFDSVQDSECVDPEVQDGDQIESIIARHVWFSYLLTHLRLIGVNYSQEPQVLPRQCLLAQPPSSTPRSQTAQPSFSRQMLPLQPPTIPAALLPRRDRPSVSQHLGVASATCIRGKISNSLSSILSSSLKKDRTHLSTRRPSPTPPENLNPEPASGNPLMCSMGPGLVNLGQITAYATSILSTQYRTHTFMVFIVKDYAMFLRWDRSGAVVTRANTLQRGTTPFRLSRPLRYRRFRSSRP